MRQNFYLKFINFDFKLTQLDSKILSRVFHFFKISNKIIKQKSKFNFVVVIIMTKAFSINKLKT